MYATVALVVLAGLAERAPEAPDVRGLIATPVHFNGAAREKAAATALELLASCSYSTASTEEDWAKVFRQCHLHVRLPRPRTVAVGDDKVKVEELLISFPTNSGGIWVRSGEDFTYFAKFDFTVCKRLQELLQAAKVSE
jgi:hypothetical protein